MKCLKSLCFSLCIITATAAYSDTPSKTVADHISYTDSFVDAMSRALASLPDQAKPSIVDLACTWSTAETHDPNDPIFRAFAESQRLKYQVALTGYDLYIEARRAALNAPPDAEASRKFRFVNYILGLSGYWELASIKPKTLLTPACSGTVQNWREGSIVNAGANFAPLTSAMGDVFLGLLTAHTHRVIGTKAAFIWGAYQEALAQFGIETSGSAWFYTTKLNPRGPIYWTGVSPKPLCTSSPCPKVTKAQSYIPQVVWLTLPIDILSYTADSTPQNVLVEARGERYMKEFEVASTDRDSLLQSTHKMLQRTFTDLDAVPNNRPERFLHWLDSLPLPFSALVDDGVLPKPQSVSALNQEMAKAILFANQVEQDLLNFPTSDVINPLVLTVPANGGPAMTICDLYNGFTEEWVLDNFSCKPQQKSQSADTAL